MRLEANTPEGRNVKAVLLDGVDLLAAGEWVKWADTDTGEVLIYLSEVIDGKRRAKCSDWETTPTGGKMRHLLTETRRGKVEVVFK